jgi:hypothetical protein
MGTSWLEWVRTLYPAVVTLVSLAGLCILLWLGTKFASKATVDRLHTTSIDHETRLQLLEETVEQSPTKQELHEEISGLKSNMAAAMAKIDAIGTQLKTTNDYLHTLIDKAMGNGGRR